MYTQFNSFRYIRSAIQLWKVRWLQAALSSLGIIVGVSGLVLVIALGEGAGRELEAALGTLGSGSVIITRQKGEDQTQLISNDRVIAVRRLLSDYLANSTVMKIQQANALSSEAHLDATKIIGTDRRYQAIYKLQLHSGRFLTELDLIQRQRVCVLGWEAAKSLFPRGQVVGRHLRIDNNWYQVVGWLQPISRRLPRLEAVGLSEIDQVVYVPVTALGNTMQIGFDQLVFNFRSVFCLLSTSFATYVAIQKILLPS